MSARVVHADAVLAQRKRRRFKGALCGIAFVPRTRRSDDWRYVTCKHCLRRAGAVYDVRGPLGWI